MRKLTADTRRDIYIRRAVTGMLSSMRPRFDSTPKDDDESNYLYRLTVADKRLLNERATAAGCRTIRQYLDLVALGREAEPRLGRPRNSGQQELPLSG